MASRNIRLAGFTAVPLIGAVAFGLSIGPAAAVPTTPGAGYTHASTNAQPSANTATNSKSNAQKLVKEAASVAQQMEKNPKLVDLMKKAKGIYIVPSFGRGGFIIGGRGGAGVLLVKQNGGWSDPGFYDFGGISVGPQVGASGGSVAFLLMNDHAVNVFKNKDEFSLNAGAGFTIVNFSNNTQASWGKGDIILWSDTSGAYVGASVSVSDIVWDKGNNKIFYGKPTTLDDILAGGVNNDQANKLKMILPS
jgi:SH3 domain-containing YSC84-like protein 1